MRSEKQIIGIGGLIGAGKSTVAKIISENRDWELLSFGKMIEEIVIAEGREPNRKNKQDKGLEIINEKGYKGIAQLLLDHYQFKEINSYVIEGIRHPEVIKFYRDIFKVSFQFLFIDCPWEIRVERISKKQFKDKNEYDNDLKSIEEHKVESNTLELLREADLTIDNSAGINELEKKLEDYKLILKSK